MGRDVTLAFCLTLGAGLATTIGAAISFCVPITFVDVLPIALSFSAGVMIYVSFVEILGKSLEAFEDVLNVDNNKSHTALAHFYLSLTFFSGIAIGFLINFIVHKLGWQHNHNDNNKNKNNNTKSNNKSNTTKSRKYINRIKSKSMKSPDSNTPNTPNITNSNKNIIADSEIVSLQNDNNNNSNFIKNENSDDSHENSPNGISPNIKSNGINPIIRQSSDSERQHTVDISNHSNINSYDMNNQNINNYDDDVIETGDFNDNDNDNNNNNVIETEEDKSLIRMSLITALAISLHNFPEGLATFVATLADPSLGVSIAVAIAIHNIPEGISVSMPVYFATQSKLQSFFWSFLSGIAEPIGGFIGYLIVDSMFGDAVFGVLFGITAGLMIYISFKELLPTARRKDKNDKYSTILLFAGFIVMDVSLILFKI